MKKNSLHFGKAMSVALFVLLLGAVGMTKTHAQNISFADSISTINRLTNGDEATMNRSYSDLPTFEFNGHTYKVAPDPQQSFSEYISYYAASSYCENLTLYGYSDWRMPTIEELEMMYQNRQSIGGFVQGSGDYDWMLYHSSTYGNSSGGHIKLLWVNGGRIVDANLEVHGFLNYDSGSAIYYCRTHVRPIRVHIDLPTVTTNDVTDISQNYAVCGGNVTNDGGTEVTTRGVCWNTSPNPTISNNYESNGWGTGSYICGLTNLTPGTQYYVRAYATNSEGTAYGNEVTFSTNSYGVPTITTKSMYNITTTTAQGGGNVVSNGGYSLLEQGICWSTNPNPTISNSHISSPVYSWTNSFTISITGLIPGTQYYVRAYAINNIGTAYGNEVSFTTTSPPTVTTNNVTNITANSATCGGNVAAEGSGAVTARGVCWSTSPNPTINNSHTNNGTGTGSFTSNITGLDQNTLYYVRAYATNSEGTAYGEEKYFTTTRWLDVTTNDVTYITQTSAICGGYVTSYNGGTVTARGVCWSASNQNPTISNIHTSDGTGTGSFTSNLTGLVQNTTYYVRAYATTSQGTVYGETKQLTTTKFEYRISEGGVVATSAGGFFYDSGGPNGYYNNNEQYIMTFKSNQGAGTKIQMAFTEFYTDNASDYLIIYDGMNTSAPMIGTYYYGNSPGTVTATNSDGALTYVFISNNVWTASGWKAAITIIMPSNTISVSANPSNGGTVSGGGYYNNGESCTLTATPASGYNFVKWTKNGTQVSTNPTYTFTVTGNASYVAHFSQSGYPISASANPSYGGTVTGGGTYNYGANCLLTAVANTGFTFLNWTKNGTVVSTNPSYNFTVTEAATYVANFQQQQTQTYAINVSANPTIGGTVSGGGTYAQGAYCTLMATANNGYTFVNWKENGTIVSTNAMYTFSVTRNRNLVANFQQQTQSYAINVSANPTIGGTVTGGGTYAQGAYCTLMATANNGYTFTNWKENGTVVSTSPAYAFTVTGNRTLVAHFNQVPYSGNIVFVDANVKALCVANWDINGDGELSYAEAASVTSLGQVFKSNSTIASFNELQYFTGLTAIGERAFYNCSSLTSVIVPNSVTVLDQYAFAFCYYLSSIELPNSLTTIGYEAFDGCYRMNSITLPNTVTTIGGSAFWGCSGLTSLEIPASVTSIGNYVFFECTGLEQIAVAAGNTVFDSRNNCNAIIETATNTLRYGCKNSFIPNTVTALGDNAFRYMGISSVNIPKSVVTIGSNVFGGCGLLEQVTVATNNPVFDSRNNCNAVVEKGTNKLVFGCKNTIIPNTVTTIGEYAFYNCEGLTSITIPNSVTVLDQYAFAFCYYLSSIELPNSLTTIGYEAFDGCYRMNSITLPNTVTTIGGSAFWGCSGLTSFMIPASVTSIGYYAFYGCTGLTTLTSLAQTPPTLGNNAFMNVDKSIPVYVPYGTVLAYQTASGWNEFTNYQETNTQSQTVTLTRGWNWWSSYIELTGIDGLGQLENSIGVPNAIIQSQYDGYVKSILRNGSVLWGGALSSINNEEMYKIGTKYICAATMEGQVTDPANHPITIVKGWNWIGFPCSHSVSISDALSGFTPRNGDVIKGINSYATFRNGTWSGTLNTLEPGQGYMYGSKSNAPRTLVFQTGNRGEATLANITPENNYYQPVDDFADNMTVIAVVELDGEELRSDNYELAAFADDECRGSVKLMYVEPVNRYVAFLTVFGDETEDLHFELTDGVDMNQSYDLIQYETEGIEGSLDEPVVLRFGATDVNGNAAVNVRVYPNPSNGVFNIEGNGIRRIEVVNVYGQVILSKEVEDHSLQIDLGNNAAGIYMLRVITDGGIATSQIIKK